MTTWFFLVAFGAGASIHGDEPWRSLVAEQLDNREGDADNSNWEVYIRSNTPALLQLKIKDPRRRSAKHTWRLLQEDQNFEARMIAAYLISVFQDEVELHWIRGQKNSQNVELDENERPESLEENKRSFRVALGGGAVFDALGASQARTQGLVALGIRWNFWRFISLYFDLFFVPPSDIGSGASSVRRWALPIHLGVGPRWEKGRWALDGGVALAFRTGAIEIERQSPIMRSDLGTTLRMGTDYLVHERLELGFDLRLQLWFRRQSIQRAEQVVYDGDFAQLTSQLWLGYRF